LQDAPRCRIWALPLRHKTIHATGKAKATIRTVYRSVFNWRTVRAFGAVQLLTKASYAMLVFVPLLAGLWSLAHFGIVEVKRELLEHADKLDKSAVQLLINRQENASTKPVGDLDSAAQRARNVAEDMRHAADMPSRLSDICPPDHPTILPRRIPG
jgi:hypothetical protein